METLNDVRYQDLDVIGQSAEKEIIFCYHNKRRRIICFDQHAVDERIRYEKLLEESKDITDYDAIKTKACHGAIKFGDKLNLGKCNDLMERLLMCKVPFRCAHSRCGVSVLESLDKILHMDRMKDR